MAVTVAGYYTQNGVLFKESSDALLQAETYKAKSLASALILSNHRARAEIQRVPLSTPSRIIHDPLTDSWFWFNMYSFSSHSHFHPPTYGGYVGGCGGCGSCSGGGGGGDGCVIILLVLAIAALVAAIVIAAGFVVVQGIDADKARQKINEISQLQQEVSSEKTEAVYERMLLILQEQHTDKSLKTTFTALITVGLGLLTVSACLALYAVLHHLPYPPLVQNLAIAGGSAAGAGLIAHGIRSIVHSAREQNRRTQYQELISAVKNLGSHMTHPYEALKSIPTEKVYIQFNGMIFSREGEHDFKRQPDGGLSQIQLEKEGFVLAKIESKN